MDTWVNNGHSQSAVPCKSDARQRHTTCTKLLDPNKRSKAKRELLTCTHVLALNKSSHSICWSHNMMWNLAFKASRHSNSPKWRSLEYQNVFASQSSSWERKHNLDLAWNGSWSCVYIGIHNTGPIKLSVGPYKLGSCSTFLQWPYYDNYDKKVSLALTELR